MEPQALSDDRFTKISMLIGAPSLDSLKNAHVTIVGLGAVGSFALEALARSGIGRFRLVDFDVVRPSNSNRQILALSETFGRKKIDVAKERVLSINPESRIESVASFIDPEYFTAVFAEPTDIVIDAIDGLNSKVSLLSLLCSNNIPVISSLGAARKTNPANVIVGDISEVSVCRLGRRVRKRLRKEGIYCGIRCVYSIEELEAVSVQAGKEGLFSFLRDGMIL